MIVALAAGGSSARAKDWQTEELLRGREENWDETREWRLRPISRTRVK